MKSGFEEFYHPTKDGFALLWADAEIVLDTSVLLNVYRYSEDTRGTLLEVLGALADRLWLPHQAVLEYHRRRADVIFEQRASTRLQSRVSRPFLPGSAKI